MDGFLGYPLNGEGAANLQKLLEVSIGILMSFATEWASLDHRDQSRFQLEIEVGIDHGWSCRYIGGRRSRKLTNGLVGHREGRTR